MYFSIMDLIHLKNDQTWIVAHFRVGVKVVVSPLELLKQDARCSCDHLFVVIGVSA